MGTSTSLSTYLEDNSDITEVKINEKVSNDNETKKIQKHTKPPACDGHAVVLVHQKELAVFGYIRIFYDAKWNSTVHKPLQSMIMEYIKFDDPKTIIFSNASTVELLLKTDMKYSGNITYNKETHHCRIHCFGDAIINGNLSMNQLQTRMNRQTAMRIYTQDFYDRFSGHLELIVDGDLTVKGHIATNHLIHWNDLSDGSGRCSAHALVRNKKEGGILDIMCYNLFLQSGAEIHACGNEFGGRINLNVKNDMLCTCQPPFGFGYKIFANACYKYDDKERIGGEININVGNNLDINSFVKIDVGGNIFHRHHHVKCDKGVINLNSIGAEKIRPFSLFGSKNSTIIVNGTQCNYVIKHGGIYEYVLRKR